MIHLPFSFLPWKILKKHSNIFLGLASSVETGFASLEMRLVQTGIPVAAKQYLAMCMLATFSFFIFILFIFELFFWGFGSSHPILYGFLMALVISMLVYLQQVNYPRLLVKKKIKNIEQNLLPALQDFLVQLNAGIPIFNILVTISEGNYGKLSEEFDRVVKKISSGTPQIEALEKMISDNPSILFKRVVWQIINGMKAGSDMVGVIKEILNSLVEEQIIQIQRYGSKLNPLAMFYMMIVVIIPSLGTTFIIVISSFMSLPENITKMIFYFVFGFVILFQIAFLGMIKSWRPNLLT